MEILNWPDGLRPATFGWTLLSNTSLFKSPWTGSTQTSRNPGSAWKASLSLNNLDDYESRELEALIFELDGMSGRIKLFDMGRFPSQTPYNIKCNAAVAKRGTKISTKDWPANSLVLRRGDYITVNDELKMVLTDVTSDAKGEAILKIAPQLRNVVTSGTSIEVNNPYGIFRLASDENGVSRSPAFNNDFDLTFMEHIFDVS